MAVVKIVIDPKLLTGADRAARRSKLSRSALIRDALREHLARLEVRAQEQQDREGYAKYPQAYEESLAWEREAAGALLKPFKLRDGSFRGQGLQEKLSWQEILERSYQRGE
jgi:hypothetical protein